MIPRACRFTAMERFKQRPVGLFVKRIYPASSAMSALQRIGFILRRLPDGKERAPKRSAVQLNKNRYKIEHRQMNLAG